jgi:hypothetical protein
MPLKCYIHNIRACQFAVILPIVEGVMEYIQQLVSTFIFELEGMPGSLAAQPIEDDL